MKNPITPIREPDNYESVVLRENIFEAVEDQFVEWMKTKPTGRFAVSVTVNQGGIRGKPQITKIENLE